MRTLVRRLGASLLATLIVLVAGVAALLNACSQTSTTWDPVGVPASWAQVRNGPGHRVHVAGQKIDCAACHDFADGGFRPPSPEVCESCHRKEATTHHHGGTGAESTNCLTCHAFAPESGPTPCLGCHAQTHGAAAAIVQHASVECTTCHRMHESPAVVFASCSNCHAERADHHAQHAGSRGCADCHRPHSPASAAAPICSSCHAEPSGTHPAGHEACIGCHRPHDFAAGGQDACIRCHGAKETLASATVHAHASCTSCHDHHDPGAAAASCSRCHSNIEPSHGSKSACVDCHAAHPAGASAPIAEPCTSCHANIAGHDDSVHARGMTCEGCHRPHGFAVRDPVTVCAGCHSQELALVSRQSGHRDCATCHGANLAHAPSKAAPCVTCHATEHATAPLGHQACQSCHDPHAGLPAQRCASCHTRESTGIHGSVPGACATCHRAHGPNGVAAPPACTTCHERTTLPALHALEGHAACANCHGAPHDPPRADRATCTGACHLDKRDHQPQATACNGCHVFRR